MLRRARFRRNRIRSQYPSYFHRFHCRQSTPAHVKFMVLINVYKWQRRPFPFQAAGKVRCVACSGSAKAAWACSMSRLMSAISASVCASSHRRVGQTSRSHADCSKGPARWLRTDTGIVLLRPQVAKDDDGQVGAVKVLRERVDDVDLLRRAAPGFAGRAPSAWHRLRIEAAAVRPPRATVPRSFSSFCRTGSSRCS